MTEKDDVGGRLCSKPCTFPSFKTKDRTMTRKTHHLRKLRVAEEIGFALLYVGYRLVWTLKRDCKRPERCWWRSVGKDCVRGIVQYHPFKLTDDLAYLKSGIIA
jgi:hypothetical protein